MFRISYPEYELTLIVVESVYMISSKITLPPPNGRTFPFDFRRREGRCCWLRCQRAHPIVVWIVVAMMSVTELLAKGMAAP
jgi:hypothetical protein